MPRKSDVRLDRVIVVLSDALEEASFELATMTTDSSGSFFLMFRYGAGVSALFDASDASGPAGDD